MTTGITTQVDTMTYIHFHDGAPYPYEGEHCPHPNCNTTLVHTPHHGNTDKICNPEETMNRYRILYNVNDQGKYRDIESYSLAHALWEVAKLISIEESTGAELIDTMTLPSKGNIYDNPIHVNLYPNWEQDNQ